MPSSAPSSPATCAPAQASPGLSAGVYAAITPIFALVLALAAPAVFNDGDTWWHLATGQWILAHHAVPTADVFSFSAPGAPWSAHEWLTEVLYAGAFALAGWSGVAAVAGMAIAGALLIISRRALHDGLAGIPLLALMLIAFSLMSASLLVRPHLFGLLLLAFWVTQLMAARDAGRAPPLWLLGVMLLWVNMHASFLLGLAILGPFALEALVEAPAGQQRLRVLRDWALFGLGAALVALVNPQGYEAFVYPVYVMKLKLLASIIEWRPANFEHIEPMEIALLALIGMALMRPVRLKPLRLALLLGLIHLALHQGRQQMVLAIVAPLLLAGPMALAFACEQPAPGEDRKILDGKILDRKIWRGVLALMALCVVLRLSVPLQRVDSPTAPLSALAALPPELRAQPVLNELSFGGSLIFHGLRPFIDGRTDMYGDPFFAAYDHAADGDAQAFDIIVNRYAIKWTLFPPAAPVNTLLAARPDWKKLYADPYAVVFVHAGPVQ